MKVEIIIPKEYLAGNAEIYKSILECDSSCYNVNRGDIISLSIDRKLRKCIVLGIEDLITDPDISGDIEIYRNIKIVPIDESVK